MNIINAIARKKIAQNFTHLILLLSVFLTGCTLNGAVGYQPPLVPISISINTQGEVSVSWSGSIQTPIGRFFVETSGSTNLADMYPLKEGVLVVDVEGSQTVYDLDGANNLSIELESGYYEKVAVKKEGKNWSFIARRISGYSSGVTINLTNNHCQNVDFYVDHQLVISSLPPNRMQSFNVSAGTHATNACVTGDANSCGSSTQVDWTFSTSYQILKGSQCDNSQPDVKSGSCDQGLSDSVITPYNPTLRLGTKFTVTITFSNPNDCDLSNVKYTLGWKNDLAGPSSFTVPYVSAHGTANVSLSFTAPSDEGTGYFTVYDSNLTICGYSSCAPAYAYVTVEGSKKKKP